MSVIYYDCFKVQSVASSNNLTVKEFIDTLQTQTGCKFECGKYVNETYDKIAQLIIESNDILITSFINYNPEIYVNEQELSIMDVVKMPGFTKDSTMLKNLTLINIYITKDSSDILTPEQIEILDDFKVTESLKSKMKNPDMYFCRLILYNSFKNMKFILKEYYPQFLEWCKNKTYIDNIEPEVEFQKFIKCVDDNFTSLYNCVSTVINLPIPLDTIVFGHVSTKKAFDAAYKLVNQDKLKHLKFQEKLNELNIALQNF